MRKKDSVTKLFWKIFFGGLLCLLVVGVSVFLVFSFFAWLISFYDWGTTFFWSVLFAAFYSILVYLAALEEEYSQSVSEEDEEDEESNV